MMQQRRLQTQEQSVVMLYSPYMWGWLAQEPCVDRSRNLTPLIKNPPPQASNKEMEIIKKQL